MNSGRRRGGRFAVLGMAILVAVGACSGDVKVGPQAIEGKRPDGHVSMKEVQAAYIGSGSAGEGTLEYRGRSHPFKVGGVGVGGIGLSTIEAEGEVYDLEDLAEFPGTYAEARYGFAFGTKSEGDLWLQNAAGVILHLKAKRQGLILSLGGDAILISMDQ